ncbi:UNVERIFIED_ORG: hypothetical protein JN05_01324 [Zoogloea ramigera]
MLDDRKPAFYDGWMDIEHRVVNLEEFAAVTGERLARIEARLEDMATKADLAELRAEVHRSANETIRWIVGMGIGLGVAGITIITFVLNNATPKVPPAPGAPITIYTQPAPATAQAPGSAAPRQP